jgi:hypothetical protein
MPYLKRFINDWPTEEIVKQYFKNRRRNHYRHGWLTPPSKYDHLKDNSARRCTLGSRVKRAKVSIAAKKRARRGRGRRRSDEDKENSQDEPDQGSSTSDVEMGEA